MSTRSKGKRNRYSAEQLAFLRAGYAKMPIRDLLPAFNRKFGLKKTAGQIRSTFKNHGITCGRKPKERFVIRTPRIYTPAQAEWLKKNYQGRDRYQITELFNRRFRQNKTVQQIVTFVHNRGLINGYTGHFPKGHVPFNKGTKGVMKRNQTTFQKGNIPGNIRPLGAERVCPKDGFVLVKVSERNPYTGHPTRFKHKHVVLWERKHGPVPKGKVVAFRDGDNSNFADDNLILLSRAELLRLNQNCYKNMPGELKPSFLTLTKLEVKIFERSKA